MRLLGPRLWRELHTKTGADRAWLDKFTGRIACGECRSHWLGRLKDFPPVFGEGWFAWSVLAHNLANARIGKDQVPVDEAGKLWGISGQR